MTADHADQARRAWRRYGKRRYPADLNYGNCFSYALADRARDYVDAASSANIRRAYASDWKHFSGWCRRQGLEVLPPSAQTVRLYITACASGAATADRQPNESRRSSAGSPP